MSKLYTRALDAEYTINEDSRTIHGLAIPTNVRSAFIHDFDGDYYEIILPSAVNEELIASNDIKIYLNHDSSQGTFARSKYGVGSLDLMITERGLEFEFEMPNTAFGNALLEGIKRGDYDAISFAFLPDKERWAYDENGEPLHYVESFRVVDEISILSCKPAFSATEVEIRSLQEFKDKQEHKYNESITKLDETLNAVTELYNKWLDIEF